MTQPFVVPSSVSDGELQPVPGLLGASDGAAKKGRKGTPKECDCGCGKDFIPRQSNHTFATSRCRWAFWSAARPRRKVVLATETAPRVVATTRHEGLPLLRQLIRRAEKNFERWKSKLQPVN
jgi:hypothetical protein